MKGTVINKTNLMECFLQNSVQDFDVTGFALNFKIIYFKTLSNTLPFVE